MRLHGHVKVKKTIIRKEIKLASFNLISFLFKILEELRCFVNKNK